MTWPQTRLGSLWCCDRGALCFIKNHGVLFYGVLLLGIGVWQTQVICVGSQCKCMFSVYSSVCHAYSRPLFRSLRLRALKRSASKPVPRSTPSQRYPGRMPYLFGGDGPAYCGPAGASAGALGYGVPVGRAARLLLANELGHGVVPARLAPHLAVHVLVVGGAGQRHQGGVPRGPPGGGERRPAARRP